MDEVIERGNNETREPRSLAVFESQCRGALDGNDPKQRSRALSQVLYLYFYVSWSPTVS